ncbi:hypothetical protein GYMLUDRAFT_45759 [Collybiopsis luxurians FD-317 M1]|uniref:Uncharacterized protein n=1 Tax=Collybiopsis luxurians FD-317 M1 TaxID=944289 RepID=A0A0D0CI49_9AGAR|nr:hypothetical protein GYMLUDRAFT_45759 [Collybiopsis luxurians FD-317 M1]
MHLRFYLLFASIALPIADVAGDAGAEASPYSFLNNNQGGSPCDMKSQVEDCPNSGSSKVRDAGPSGIVPRSSPSPNNCTCSNVYFNVWSACLLLTGTANLMVPSNNWTDTCKQQGFEMTNSLSSQSKNQDLPSWAYIELPANQTFNIAQAFSLTSPNSKHNISRIVTPVVVGIAVFTLLFGGFIIWRSKKSGSLQRMWVPVARGLRNGFGTSKITTGSRDQGWVIDRPVESIRELEMLSTSSRRSTGHIRLSSSTSSASLDFVKPGKTTWALPGKNLWKNSSLGRTIRRTADLLPVPWRGGPVTVQSISPPRKFEIDATSARTGRTESTLENYRRGGFRLTGTPTETTESGPPTSRYDYHEIIDAIEEEPEDSDLDLDELNLDDDSTRLISRRDRQASDDVMVISESDNFTVNTPSTQSAAHRIPPSPARPRSDSPIEPIEPPPESPVRNRPQKKWTRRAPPAPDYPAPLPNKSPSYSPPRTNQLLAKSSIDTVLQSSNTSASKTPPSHSSPQRRPLPLPNPHGAASVSSRPTGNPAASQPFVPIPPPPPPSFHPGASISTKPLLHASPNSRPVPLPQRPPQGHPMTHNRNPSSSTDVTSESFPFVSSPPYRSSPLPEEIRIARSGSPPPPPSMPNSPPFFKTQFSNSKSHLGNESAGRSTTGGGVSRSPPAAASPPAPSPPLPHQRHQQHHRLMSLPSTSSLDHGRGPGSPGLSFTSSGLGSAEGHSSNSSFAFAHESGVADHPGYPFEATLANPHTRMHFRNLSVDSLTSLPSARNQPHGQHNHTRSDETDESPVDPALLFPGAVRGARVMGQRSGARGGSGGSGGHAGGGANPTEDVDL